MTYVVGIDKDVASVGVEAPEIELPTGARLVSAVLNAPLVIEFVIIDVTSENATAALDFEKISATKEIEYKIFRFPADNNRFDDDDDDVEIKDNEVFEDEEKDEDNDEDTDRIVTEEAEMPGI